MAMVFIIISDFQAEDKQKTTKKAAPEGAAFKLDSVSQ